MHPRNVWQAMTRPGFLLPWWPWRSVAHLVGGAMTGAVVLVAVLLLAVTGGTLAVVLVGLPLLVALPWPGFRWPGSSGSGCGWSTWSR